MAACDLVVVNPSITFAFTEVRIGVAPAIITAPILARCGWSKLAAPYLTGEVFDAARALDIGLVTHVCDDVQPRSTNCAGDLLLGGPNGSPQPKHCCVDRTDRPSSKRCRNRCSPATKVAKEWPPSGKRDCQFGHEPKVGRRRWPVRADSGTGLT